jgi:hypothetical protein
MIKQREKPETIFLKFRNSTAIIPISSSQTKTYFNVGNSRKGLQAQCGGKTVIFIRCPIVLGTKWTKGKGKNARTVLLSRWSP